MADERVFTKDLESYFRIGRKQAERLFVQIRVHCGIEKFGIVRWSHVKQFEEALNKGLLRKQKEV